MDDKESYKDKNICHCTQCGLTHTTHDRAEDKNPPVKIEKVDDIPDNLESRYSKKTINKNFYGHVEIKGDSLANKE